MFDTFVILQSRSWALTILLCEKYTWALTREWALSVHLAKMGTWALTREWVLARETMVIVITIQNVIKALSKFPSRYYVVSLVCLYLEKLLKICKDGCTAEVGVFKSLLDQGADPNIHDYEVCLLL